MARSTSSIFKDNALYKLLLDNLYDGVYFVDLDQRIAYWNLAAQSITGFAPEEMVGRMCSDDMLKHLDEQGNHLCRDKCPLQSTITDGQSREMELFLHHKLGHEIPVRIRVSPLRNSDGEIIGGIETFNDDTSRLHIAQKVEELQKLVMLDPLTQIANRRYLETYMANNIEKIRRYDWKFGVLFLDVDRFKLFNDNYGHETGDRALKVIAETIKSNMRSSDVLGRWGGEEFVMAIENVEPDKIFDVGEKVRRIIEGCNLEREGAKLPITASVGATTATGEDTLKTLMERADKLMYESKKAGRNRVTAGFSSSCK